MIYEEDVREAMMFAPDIQSYTSIAGANHIVFMLSKRGLIPYVRRALNNMYGLPSVTAEYYHRYGNLIIHFVGDPYGRDPFNPYYWEDYGNEHQVFYVREKGERVGASPREVHELIANNWIPLVLNALPESDAWLHVHDNVITITKTHRMDSKTGGFADASVPAHRVMYVDTQLMDWSKNYE